MTDPFAKTRYRVAQHWRFRSDTPRLRDTLIITAVEDHPVQGIVCAVEVEYDPPFEWKPNWIVPGTRYWLTQAALDASVTELVAERGLFPRHCHSTGEFCCAEAWKTYTQPIADTRTMAEIVREAFARQRCDEEVTRPPHVPPPDEALGLWSLIALDKADRLRQLLEQHPALANAPLPRDWSDDYCYDGDEYEECYPLMLAAETDAVEVAKVLLEFGADVRRRNDRGETALHFSGKANDAGCGADAVARMLCERGADPNALNRDGKPPLTCYYCMNEVAEVLVEFGAKLNLNHALRLGKTDLVRQQLRENPHVVAEAPYPREIVDDVRHMICLADCGRYGSWDRDDLSAWHRVAEIQKQIFEEHRDILEGVVALGADPNGVSGLFYAVQFVDTTLAEWLLEHGADPNRGLPSYLPDVASSRRMVNLLKRYGALENPYPHELDEWEQRAQLQKDRFV